MMNEPDQRALVARTTWLKTDDAASEVGLSIDTIRDAIKAGSLRAYRPGGGTRGHFLISVNDLDEWVRRSPVDPTDHSAPTARTADGGRG